MGKHAEILHIWKWEDFPKAYGNVQAGQRSSGQETGLYCTRSYKLQQLVTRLKLVKASPLKAKYVKHCFFYKHPYYETDTHNWGWTGLTCGFSKDGGQQIVCISERLYKHTHTHHMTAKHRKPDMSVQCVITVCVCGLQLESIFPREIASHPSPPGSASPC